MFKILNRISWLLSLILWFIFAFSLIWLSSYRIWDDEIAGSIFFWLIIWLLVKKIMLSEKFIKSGLELSEKLKLWVLNENKVSKKEEITELKQEKTKLEAEKIKEKEETEKSIFEKVGKDIEEKEISKTIAEKTEKAEKVEKPSKLKLAFKSFFKENLLAKIWAILVFLWVLFLLSLIWNVMPSIVKIAIGFLIGFWIYFTWVFLDKKDISEGKTLIWAGILINFLVILWWKHLLSGNDISTPFLSTWVTFFLLILNTIFAVISSLIYKSKTLLIFSFIFAYLNPFLLWESSSTPYTLVWYSMVVSLWALFVGRKQNSYYLKVMAFILWNILFLLAPFSSEIWWITRFLASAVLWVLTIFDFQKNHKNSIFEVFTWTYIFLFLILWSSLAWNIFWGVLSYFTYLFTIIALLVFSAYIMTKNTLLNLSFALFWPIILVLTSLFFIDLSFVAISIWLIVVFYLVIFSFILNIISAIFKYIYFALLWGFIIIWNSYLSLSWSMDFNFSSFLVITFTSFVFFFYSYFLSRKKDLEYLFPIWTLALSLMLAPITNYESIKDFSFFNQNILIISVLAITIFSLTNTIFPFLNKNLTWENANVKSLISGSVIWILFTSFMLYSYGNVYFPWVALGLSFTALAIYYFILWFLFINKVSFKKAKENLNLRNSFYSYIAISVSIFSFSLAIIFADKPAVIATSWILEASVLFFLYQKTKDIKIFDFALIIFVIWIFKLFAVWIKPLEYTALVFIWILTASLLSNIVFIKDLEKETKKDMHNMVHILWIIIIISFIEKILVSWQGFNVFTVALFLSILWIFYSKFGTKLLKCFFLIIIWLFLLNHIWSFDYIKSYLEKDSLSYLLVLQYISTLLISWTVVFWNKFNKEKIQNYILNVILAFYLLIIISIYIYDLFHNTFLITIFWWATASVILVRWILKDKKVLRTSSLYLLSLVILKISLYDVWSSIENAFSRIIVFIVLWIILIFVSILYSRKYWNDLSWEFSIKNLFSGKDKKTKK